jgi:hypothetical protein
VDAPHRAHAECCYVVSGVTLIMIPAYCTKNTVRENVSTMIAMNNQFEKRLENMFSFLGYMHLLLNSLKI